MTDISNADQTKINNVVKEISNISIMAGINTNISKKVTNKKGPPKDKKMRKGNKPWFDNECQTKRKHFLQIKRRFVRKKTKTPIDIETLNREAKMYKKFIQMKTNLYNKNLHEKLRNLKGSKPREYWNLLNPKKRKINNSINLNSLYDHFKSLNEQPNNGNRN